MVDVTVRSAVLPVLRVSSSLSADLPTIPKISTFYQSTDKKYLDKKSALAYENDNSNVLLGLSHCYMLSICNFTTCAYLGLVVALCGLPLPRPIFPSPPGPIDLLTALLGLVPESNKDFKLLFLSNVHECIESNFCLICLKQKFLSFLRGRMESYVIGRYLTELPIYLLH